MNAEKVQILGRDDSSSGCGLWTKSSSVGQRVRAFDNRLPSSGSWWRVGRSKLYTTWGLGVKQRLEKENGDGVWILRTFDSREEASTFEQIVSVAYGIPTTFWTEANTSRRTLAMIRKIYETLDLDQLERLARQALTDCGRSVYYPFVSRNQTRHKHADRVSLLTRACNLIPDVMAVPLPGRGQQAAWEPIRAVDVQHYDGPVYSMGVDTYHHYVADGIVTHNCFYGWREGAAHQFLGPNNAVDVWSIKKVNPQNMVHLTEKPTELAVRAIQYSSRLGENVLDLFGGSGSTLIACEQTGRRCFTMELDRLYADTIWMRWEKFTGRKAERLPAG